MKVTSLLASAVLVAATAGAAHAQFVRCSWNSCDPQVVNQDFAGPAVYKLVLSMTGAEAPNIGHDVSLALFPEVPDAWRFDDAGCQTGSQLVIDNAAFSKACPAMRGANPFPITFYNYDPVSQQALLRLVNTYDEFDPTASGRYTLWQLMFDHTYSVAGAGSPGETCGGAERPLSIEVRRAEYLEASGAKSIAQVAPGDAAECLWNQSVVPAQTTTLGRLKAQYR